MASGAQTEEHEGRGEGGKSPVNDNLTKLGSRTYSSDCVQRQWDLVIYASLQKNVCYRAEVKRASVHVHLVSVNCPPSLTEMILHFIQTICLNHGARRACGFHPPNPKQDHICQSEEWHVFTGLFGPYMGLVQKQLLLHTLIRTQPKAKEAELIRAHNKQLQKKEHATKNKQSYGTVTAPRSTNVPPG